MSAGILPPVKPNHQPFVTSFHNDPFDLFRAHSYPNPAFSWSRFDSVELRRSLLCPPPLPSEKAFAMLWSHCIPISQRVCVSSLPYPTCSLCGTNFCHGYVYHLHCLFSGCFFKTVLRNFLASLALSFAAAASLPSFDFLALSSIFSAFFSAFLRLWSSPSLMSLSTSVAAYSHIILST